MNKVNADKSLEKIIEENGRKGIKPELLLHCCCAPCSTVCFERLKEGFSVTAYFYNPNIDGKEEYEKRRDELKRLCEIHGVDFFAEPFIPNEFFEAVKGLESCSERGERCFVCYKLRLKKTAERAKKEGYDCFATTLTLSPLKDSDAINEKGTEAEKETGEKYIATDFKKRNGFLRSVQMSQEYGLYRQNYCGCVFSKKTVL